MAVDDLARADPLPRIIAHLATHPALSAALGGAGRVGLYNEPPFPRLRVVDVAGGSDRDLTWLIAKAVQLEAYGDLSGAPGKSALNRIAYMALGALMELVELAVPASEPVITAVRSQTPVTWSPEPTGQPRFVASVLVYAHPS